MDLHLQKRLNQLYKASQESWDIVVVGGGITGAGIFHQASHLGYKVLLLEKEDFASGTSWISSKLIHGGLRYLEQFNFSLVFESISEKKELLQVAPHLVHSLPFTFPVYQKDRRSLFEIWVGVWLYTFLSKFNSIPQLLLKSQTLKKYSQLNPKELRGSLTYMDAQTNDTQLTLSAILSGSNENAKAFNHCLVKSAMDDSGNSFNISIEDQLTQQSFSLQTKYMVDATGPWKDLKQQESLTYSKGSHLYLQGNPANLDGAMTMFSPQDGRVMFCIPWLGNTLLGTTDTTTKEAPDHARISKEEESYLLETFFHYFPLTKDKITILSRFSGLRTLLDQKNKNSLANITRDHVLTTPTKGHIQIYGGKLTCFRKMAKEVLLKINQWEEKHTSISPPTQYKQTLNLNPEMMTENCVQAMIDQEHAFTVSDILLRRTLANLRLQDHGARYFTMLKKVLQKNFDYTDEQIQTQIQDYKTQSQQFPIFP